MLPELKVDYDAAMNPISGSCTVYGEKMPVPREDLKETAEIIIWLSMVYLTSDAKAPQ